MQFFIMSTSPDNAQHVIKGAIKSYTSFIINISVLKAKTKVENIRNIIILDIEKIFSMMSPPQIISLIYIS